MIRQWKWILYFVIVLFTGFNKAHILSEKTTQATPWDVLWLCWNDLHFITLLVLPSFMLLCVDTFIRDNQDNYLTTYYMRARSRTVVWTSISVSTLILSAIAVVGASLVIFLISIFYFPSLHFHVLSQHAQVLFGNGIGVEPNLNTNALWGSTPLVIVGLMLFFTLMEFWILSLFIIAVTIRARQRYLPIFIGLIVSVIGNAAISQVNPMILPTSQSMLYLHSPFIVNYALINNHVIKVPGTFIQSMYFSLVYLFVMAILAFLLGRLLINNCNLSSERGNV